MQTPTFVGEESISLALGSFPSSSLFNRPRPRLFHYTTLDGLRGIVESKQLRLTRVAYLNDSTEMIHALELMKRKATELETAESDLSLKLLFRDLIASLPLLHSVNTCVACFCEDGDLLSQWRGYSESGKGVAMEINPATLESIGQLSWAKVLPCVYEPADQEKIVGDLLDHFRIRYSVAVFAKTHDDSEKKRRGLIGAFMPLLLQLAPVLKHRAFREEREWRIVTLPRANVDPRFRTLFSSSRVSQYFTLDLPHNSESGGMHDFLQSVTLGPSRSPLAIDDAVSSLCRENNVCIPTVTRSAVPFRG